MKHLDELDTYKVYVGFTSGSGKIAKAIQWWTHGKVNHVFLLYYSNHWGCWVEHGAVANGFNGVAAGTGGLVKDLYALWELDGYDLSVGMQKNPKLLNSGYDFKGLVGMTVVEAAQHWFKRNWDNPIQTDARWFCSEAVARILLDAGVPLPLKSKPGSTDPQDLMVAIEKVPGSISRYNEKTDPPLQLPVYR